MSDLNLVAAQKAVTHRKSQLFLFTKQLFYRDRIQNYKYN